MNVDTLVLGTTCVGSDNKHAGSGHRPDLSMDVSPCKVHSLDNTQKIPLKPIDRNINLEKVFQARGHFYCRTFSKYETRNM